MSMRKLNIKIEIIAIITLLVTAAKTCVATLGATFPMSTAVIKRCFPKADGGGCMPTFTALQIKSDF